MPKKTKSDSPLMIHTFTILHHGLVGLWAPLPYPQIPYPPQVQLGPNLVYLWPMRTQFKPNSA